MKTIIIYYSQTGNTKKIAEAIYSGALSVNEETDLVHISEVNHDLLTSYDVIGIGTPVWCEREPVNVQRFINKLSDLEGKLAFVFCTHATLAGQFMKTIVTRLEEKKLVIVGWEDWYGGYVNPASPKPYYTDGHPDDIDLMEANNFGKDITEKCIEVINGKDSLIPQLPEKDEYAQRYGKTKCIQINQAEDNKGQVKKSALFLNKEICINPDCTLCRDYCPSESIDPSQENPYNNISCERCHFCELICPTGAITFKKAIRIDKKSNLATSVVEDMLQYKELRRFRPLVSFDTVATIMPSKEIMNSYPKLIIKEHIGVPAKLSSASDDEKS
jgi:flavodoxin/formate hydrogenlyase subunit 6/NADH:ubiquinone oxidoreductase subunit I